jgi:hypothetical protein
MPSNYESISALIHWLCQMPADIYTLIIEPTSWELHLQHKPFMRETLYTNHNSHKCLQAESYYLLAILE